MRSLTQQLASGAGGLALRGASIDGASDREIRWHAGRPLPHTGRITLLPGAGGTRAEWELTRGSGMLVVAMLVCALGALAIVWLHVALRTYVLPHENEDVRGQVVQMVQAVHLLWPPFLFAGLARGLRTQLAQDVDRLVANASFAARAAAGRG
jgi:hypothetical protein